MAAALNVHGTAVVDDGVTHSKVTIVVRQNVATVRRQREVLAQRAGVVSVTSSSRLEREVTFDDGSSWHVTRSGRPCGCG